MKNTNLLNTANLFAQIKILVEQSRKSVVSNINYTMLFTNFNIGRIIIEDEQHGEARAEYSAKTLSQISKKLTNEFGQGFSVQNLERMRNFYLLYSKRISPSRMRKSLTNSHEQKSSSLMRKSSTESNFSDIKISQIVGQLKLSWTHYIFLMKIEDQNERTFYEIEATGNNWSVRELKRQFDTSLYERIALSKDKNKVKELSQKGQQISKPVDIIKDPYVLEFLDLKEETAYTEKQLETAIIDKIEQFLLELGKGFLFDSRQKRITIDGDNFYIDLVFYNRLLKCFVLIDLKIGRLIHQDIGQMQMYVNYYDRKTITENENKTIGIVLCKQSNKAVVEFTLPEENKQIFASEYKLYLPSKKDLQNLLKEE